MALAVPLIGVQSLKWSLDNDKWQARANTIKAAHELAAKDLGEKEVNGKSPMALMAAGIPCGTEVEVKCDGADEAEALAAAIELIKSGLGE